MARRLVLMTAVGVMLTVGAGAASASPVTVSCPGARVFSITTDPGTAGCYLTGTGNINANGDALNALGWTTIDKDETPDENWLNDAWFSVAGIGGNGGPTVTFTISPARVGLLWSVADRVQVRRGTTRSGLGGVHVAGRHDGRHVADLRKPESVAREPVWPGCSGSRAGVDGAARHWAPWPRGQGPPPSEEVAPRRLTLARHRTTGCGDSPRAAGPIPAARVLYASPRLPACRV